MQTPFYRIKEADLLYDIDLLQTALSENWGSNTIMSYSVKTNALPWLLHYLKEKGFYAEIVSEMEYDLVKRLGFPGKHMIYNGPIKDKKTWEAVLLAGGFVNMDSNYELDWIEEISSLYPDRQFSVGLRVNCDIAVMCPREELAEEDGGRFGYCYENGILADAIERLNALPNVTIAGLHLHSSTKSRSVEVYGALAAMACKLAGEFSLSLSYVDMGGGYFGGRDDRPGYPQYMKEICRVLSSCFDREKTTLIVEPGVSLISRATTFETEVLDVKRIRDITYLVTDGSRVNLNPQVTRHVYPHHIVYKQRIRRETVPVQWVCGSTCMEYDRLFELTDAPALLPGDRIIYDTAGGYTICLTPLFIHYFPAVYIEKTDGEIFTAREPWGNDEYLQKYHW